MNTTDPANIISVLKENEYISGKDVAYIGVMKTIQKAKHKYQPLWEVITNAIEAIKDPNNQNTTNKITISFCYSSTLIPEAPSFDKIIIEDSGIGFNDENFVRFLRFNDDSKGNNNRGTGRFQIMHYFEEARFESIYKDNMQFRKRSFIVSCKQSYIAKNAVVFYEKTEDVHDTNTGTKVILQTIKDQRDLRLYSYDNIRTKELTKAIKEHYILLFCANKQMPIIEIKYIKDDTVELVETISNKDFPKPDKSFETWINYVAYDPTLMEYTKQEDRENFKIDTFVFKKDDLQSNSISIICKGEVVPDINLDFDFLKRNDSIEGKRFLVYVSSGYFDNLMGNTRDHLDLVRKDIISNGELPLSDKVIFYEDINTAVNNELYKQYPIIAEKEKQYKIQIEKLKSMFLLDSKTIDQILAGRQNKTFTEEQFLEKVYAYDSANDAQRDIEIKKHLESLTLLNPSSNDYNEQFNSILSSLTSLIPISNRTDITRYVARRKLILDLFEKALNFQLKIQKESKHKCNEQILHNIVFKQSSSDPNDSNLWLLNEDYIYYDGCSNQQFGIIQFNGQKLFNDALCDFDKFVKHNYGVNPSKKKPDILLFPQEGKCVIIEFKSPDVNVAHFLTQINYYSSLIMQYSNDCFNFHTFYGYFIGEDISTDEVLSHDPDFLEAPNFDILFRPFKRVRGKNGEFGSLYTEILKYSALLKRAQMRNKFFVDKISTHNAL